jgi:hypothetical protein
MRASHGPTSTGKWQMGFEESFLEKNLLFSALAVFFSLMW